MRMLRTATAKLRLMSGGLLTLTCLGLALLLCFYAVGAMMRAQPPTSLKIALVDEDGSELSRELRFRLTRLSSLKPEMLSQSEAQLALAQGKVEGMVRLGAGYGEAMRSGQTLPLSYESSAVSVSKGACREMVAGQVIAQRSFVRAYERLQAAGAGVSSDELGSLMSKHEAELPPLNEFSTLFPKGGATMSTSLIGGLYAGYPGFVALAIMLVLMTLSQWMGQVDSRRVARRMRALRGGGRLSHVSDVAALCMAGAGLILLALLGMSSVSALTACALSAYVYCVVGLCLLLQTSAVFGAMNVFAPVVALLTSILGGCFIDVVSLSPVLSAAMMFTPQGQMLHAVNEGALWPLLLLVAEGTALLMICARKSRRAV